MTDYKVYKYSDSDYALYCVVFHFVFLEVIVTRWKFSPALDIDGEPSFVRLRVQSPGASGHDKGGQTLAHIGSKLGDVEAALDKLCFALEVSPTE